MENLTPVNLYFLFSVGLLVGFAVDLVMGKRALGTLGNLASGVLGSIIIGAICFVLDIVGPLVYAALGSMLLLFLINIFSIHSDKQSAAHS
jgi:uncharacterized membrane protein YeaQ/YmgE (transglycosylase-associated protein family)